MLVPANESKVGIKNMIKCGVNSDVWLVQQLKTQVIMMKVINISNQINQIY